MTRWCPLTDSDDTLIRYAPIRFRHSVIVPAEAEPWFAALLFPVRPLVNRATRSWTEGVTARVLR
ncbi:hypothetical protein [Nocardia sp. NPDC052112]|uniref:hypothetical protein n=1 Tax=Nocardia sp. NPDC052112 TaxID=3155646 RepID=UPI00341A16F4